MVEIGGRDHRNRSPPFESSAELLKRFDLGDVRRSDERKPLGIPAMLTLKGTKPRLKKNVKVLVTSVNLDAWVLIDSAWRTSGEMPRFFLFVRRFRRVVPIGASINRNACPIPSCSYRAFVLAHLAPVHLKVINEGPHRDLVSIPGAFVKRTRQ